jgi:hypothetical protein
MNHTVQEFEQFLFASAVLDTFYLGTNQALKREPSFSIFSRFYFVWSILNLVLLDQYLIK